jgi:Asp-tRNA(Asn)/Glu-tRNA(Gln) amidotransferase B subunit
MIMNACMFRSFRKGKEETKMSENQKKILEMLADKKISVDEAHRLLSALKAETDAPESTAGAGGTAGKPKRKYLRVSVVPGAGHEHDEEAELVNVRVPMSLIRSGMKLSSLLPSQARDKVTEALNEKGINLDMRNMKPEDLEEIIEALDELEVNVVSDEGVVRVFVE